MSKEAIKYVKFILDPDNPSRMTPEEKARLDAMTDDDIVYDEDSPDTSDWPDTGWTRPGITLYVDPDIAKYFRRESDYHLDSERINEVLREYIAVHPKAG